MTHSRFLAVQRLILAACCALPGCSGSDRLETFPVRGKVTYRGRPVADASVAFLAPGAPRLAVGRTDESGTFSLTTFEPDDGAIPGTHVVTVRKYSVEPATTHAAPADGKIDHAAIERAMQETAVRLEKEEKSGSELPTKYADYKTTDLHKEVVAGENVINIELID